MACASCHLEGGDDGRSWSFGTVSSGPSWTADNIGTRRTQNLRQALAHQAPFHWRRNVPTLRDLMNEGMHERMSRPSEVSDAEAAGLDAWLQSLRPPCPTTPTSAADVSAVARGHTLYVDLSCATCHDREGEKGFFNIGTGGTFVAPRLEGLRTRAPYMHNGCARTLRERFTSPECGGTGHRALFEGRQFPPIEGREVVGLTLAQINDLVAFLNTL